MEVDVNLGEGERDAPFFEAIDPRIAGLEKSNVACDRIIELLKLERNWGRKILKKNPHQC